MEYGCDRAIVCQVVATIKAAVITLDSIDVRHYVDKAVLG